MSDGPTLTVKNWRVFQHYTKRNPPWVKLQKSILDDYEFQCLPLASRALAPMLWLLASESSEGSIAADPAKLAFRLRWTVKDINDGLKPLIAAGFLVDASNALADCKQSATSETETETEKKGAKAPFDPSSVPGLDAAAWSEWVEYRKAIGKALKPASMAAAAKEMAAMGPQQRAAVTRSKANGYTGLFAPSGNSTQPTKTADPYRNAL